MENEENKSNNRDIKIVFRVSKKEWEIINLKKEYLDIKTVSDYVRTAAVFTSFKVIDKKLINEIFTSISAVRSSLNQIAKRINSTSRVYDEDMKKIADMHEVLNKVSSQLVNLNSKK